MSTDKFDFLDEEAEGDFEIGRYALRSFKFVVERARGSLAEQIGWWTDGTCKSWRPVAYTRAEGWLDGTCEAVCHAYGIESWGGDSVLPTGKRHQAPYEDCKCGIYGSLSYADLIAQFSEARNIVAVIAVEGNTIIGTRGLRTQFARVVAYWVAPDPIWREVAASQFKDAEVFGDPLEMVESYGLGLLPPASEDKHPGPAGAAPWWTKSE